MVRKIEAESPAHRMEGLWPPTSSSWPAFQKVVMQTVRIIRWITMPMYCIFACTPFLCLVGETERVGEFCTEFLSCVVVDAVDRGW